MKLALFLCHMVKVIINKIRLAMLDNINIIIRSIVIFTKEKYLFLLL